MNPSHEKKLPVSPREWVAHAESDLKLALLGMDDPDVRREMVCFHTQQAAEKAIKAVLLAWNIEFPLTHDIGELLEIAEENGLPLSGSVSRADSLTPYAVLTRYPGFWEEILPEDVEEAIEVAQDALRWAEDMLKKQKGDS